MIEQFFTYAILICNSFNIFQDLRTKQYRCQNTLRTKGPLIGRSPLEDAQQATLLDGNTMPAPSLSPFLPSQPRSTPSALQPLLTTRMMSGTVHYKQQ